MRDGSITIFFPLYLFSASILFAKLFRQTDLCMLVASYVINLMCFGKFLKFRSHFSPIFLFLNLSCFFLIVYMRLGNQLMMVFL